MEKIELYEFQAKRIEDTLRLVANLLHSRSKETCLDRDVMQSWEFIKNALNKDIGKTVNRM